jgi:diguanylate cyclase (GGDEF)-like protein
MPSIRREWCEIARNVITEAQEKLNEQIVSPLNSELPGVSLQGIAPEFFRKMRDLLGVASDISFSTSATPPALPEMPAALVPLFKAFFLRARLAKARELDQQKARSTNPLVLSALEEQLIVYDGIIREEWFQAASPEYPLSLSDVLTLERVEHLNQVAGAVQRQYDEKFHILQAPGLFLPDLHYYRNKCAVRKIPVTIAFLDIDKFKDFNTDVGETNVDRHVLPVFMRAVEAHFYGHGYAYRYGGDEYAILMPNAGEELSLVFVGGLRDRLAELRFSGTERKLTVSVGLCVADRDCHLTDNELLQRAERAKNYAKGQGRDRVVGYAGRLFDDTELRVLLPAPAPVV